MFLLQILTITAEAPHWSFVLTKASTSMSAEQSEYQTVFLSHIGTQTWTWFEGRYD